MAIVGGLLIVLCVVLLLFRRSQQGKLLEIRSTETLTAKELIEAAKYVTERMGEAGSFNRIAEIKGFVRCDQPITSELAQQPCVYYDMTVTREYEEDYWQTDSQSKRQVRRTRRASEPVAHNSQRIPFWVEDSTGRIKVNPEGADVDGVQVVDRFEQPRPSGGLVLSFGGFSMDLGGFGGARTLGYRMRESVLPLDRKVYVLGEVRDSSGELAVERPREKKRFLISLKSEEELVKSAQSAVQWLTVGAAASGIAGVVLIVVDLVGAL